MYSFFLSLDVFNEAGSCALCDIASDFLMWQVSVCLYVCMSVCLCLRVSLSACGTEANSYFFFFFFSSVGACALAGQGQTLEAHGTPVCPAHTGRHVIAGTRGRGFVTK